MNQACRALLVFAFISATAIANSQDSQVPFARLENNSHLQTLSDATEPAGADPTESRPSALAGSAFTPVHSTQFRHPRILDRNYFLLNGIHMGMAIFDVEMTQHCMAEHRCTESNPIMPSSQAGAISVAFGFVGYTAATSYRMKKHQVRIWWMAPVVGIAAHTAGASTGLALR